MRPVSKSNRAASAVSVGGAWRFLRSRGRAFLPACGGMSWWTYPLLFFTGLAAGLVDSIAGGGGIISLPVLLNLGLPPTLALGTNKLQGTCGSVSATWHYARSGLVDWRACRLGIAATLAGALAGAWVVQRIDAQILGKIIPWLLAAIVVYAIVRPRVGEQDCPPRLRADAFFALFGLGFGFYDGFFGPGVGSFWTIALVALLGYNFMKATAGTKVMNATSNIASLALFAANGQVNYSAGALMGAGQIVGARIGAGLAVRRGVRFVRPVFLTMVVLVMARLLWLAYLR
jgi:uncharacterized protein